MTETRETLAAAPRGSSASLPYPGSAVPASFGKRFAASAGVVFGNLIGSPRDGKRELTRSAPITTYAQRGRRPGAEDGHLICDTHHTNFIIAGRSAA